MTASAFSELEGGALETRIVRAEPKAKHRGARSEAESDELSQEAGE